MYSKILEHIVYTSIFSHLQQCRILTEEQHGFQAGKLCETQIIMTIDNFANCINDNSQIDCIFLDFSKAFDRVPHIIVFATNYHIMELEVLFWNR